MRHATTCKFCHNPITIEVDAEYAELGDPLKLLPLAACNQCADLRVERRFLEDRIRKAAMIFAAIRKPGDEAKQVARVNFTSLCTRYARMIARWHRVEGMSWDQAIVDQMMERPEQWPDTLSQMWKMFSQWREQQEVGA